MKVMKAMRLFMVAGFALCIFISANPGGAESVYSLPGGTVIRMPELDYQGYGPKTLGPDDVAFPGFPRFRCGLSAGPMVPLFGTNGLWLVLALAPNMGPIAILARSKSCRDLEFSKPVQAVGGFLNYYYYPNATFSIAVYDSSHTLIENKTLSFQTDGGYNKGFFYGFQEASNKIRYFTLTGNAAIGITNLTTVTRTPCPASGRCIYCCWVRG